MILAHIGPVPIEEMLAMAPAFAGVALAIRARFNRRS